jgi:hypothetical protein
MSADKKLKVYVASPVSSSNRDEYLLNIKRAKEIGLKILKASHYPYVPHTHFFDWEIDIFKYHDQLLNHGLKMIESWAGILFFIGPSKGALAERAEAERLGKKVIFL